MKYRNIVIALVILVSLGFGLFQYRDKQLYVKHLSGELSNVVARIAYSLSDNKKIYEEILSSKTISLDQMEMILSDNNLFFKNVQEYEAIAVNFKRAKQEDFNGKTAVTASRMGSIFYQIQWNIASEKGIDELAHLTTVIGKTEPIKLDEDELEHIRTIHALNDLWCEALVKNLDGVNPVTGRPTDILDIYREKGFLRKDWIKLLKEFNSITTEFLEEHEEFEEKVSR